MIAIRYAMAAELRPSDDPIAERSSREPEPTVWEWPTRAFFGVLLAALAILAIFAGGLFFAGFLAIIAVAAAREWHRMVSGRRFALEMIFTSIAIASALLVAAILPGAPWPVLVLAAGSLLASVASERHGASLPWSAGGAFYIGAPALCLVALRTSASHAAWVVLGVFIAVWAADTGALLWGRFIGGPKLLPVLSPNKTWAGMAGGIVFPAISLWFYVTILGGNGWKGAVLGAALALAGHMGDLFESWVKRRVGRKNSGSLIPGHGGVLDRIDSTLFAAPLAAALVFVFGLDPLFGAHP